MNEKIKNSFQSLLIRVQGGILQLMTASVLNKVLAMLGNMVVTRLMTRAEYGIWSYAGNIYGYLSLISGLGLISGAFQFGAENRGTDAEFKYYRFCLNCGLLIDTVLAVVFIGLSFFISFALENAVPYIRGFCVFLLLEYVQNLLLTVLRCENRIKEYARILNINTILNVAGNCAGAFWGARGMLFAKFLTTGIFLAFLVARMRPEICKVFSAAKLRFRETGDLWKYSLFTGASATMNMLLYLIDVSMVAGLLCDSEVVATYKVATLIPNALGFIPYSVITSVLPQIIHHRNDTPWLKKNLRTAYLGLGAVNFALCILLIAFAPLIITAISGKQYLASSAPFRVLVAGYFLSGTFRALSVNILAGLRHVSFNLLISIVSCLCDVAFNFVFIGKFGVMGAAYATFAVEAVTAVMGFSFLYVNVYIRRKTV